MQCFQGKSVYKGIVMGPVAVLKKNDYQVKRARIEDPEAEVKRVKEAVEVSKKQLGRLYDKAVREVGEASAAIFEVHQMMLEDEDYLESMENMIRTELVNAEYAAAATGDNFAEMFAAMDDEYMKARSADVKDISERLVRNLSGEGDNDLSSMEPSVIVADDLSPSETVQMDKEKILAFVTVHGSTNSHTAILARMMNIPALIGVPMDLNSLKTGMMAVVDGFSGQVIFEPEEDVQKETEKRMQEEAEKQKLLEELKGKENIMGKEIKVVCGLIYDDEFHARTGGTRFYHLNGDIETNADGEQVYVCTKQNQQGKFEDITEPVSNLPIVVQRFIELYAQNAGSDRNVKYIGKHSSELV